MRLSSKGLDLIKRFEGLRLEAYRCPAAVWTIGYGSTGEHVYEGLTITEAEAESLLKMDLGRFEKCVNETCPQATQSQFDAMVSLAYNIGCAGFKRSSVARLHKAGRYPEAQQAFALWNKAGGKVLNGLVTRRAREADRYDDDDLPTDTEGMPQAVEGEKPMSKSRTVNGQAVAGGATALTMAAPAVPDGTMETIKAALGDLTAVTEYAYYGLAALALAGILWSLWARYDDRRTGRS